MTNTMKIVTRSLWLLALLLAPSISIITAQKRAPTKTPNIDRLAKEGMKFENCFVTNSICTPSRAAILTGKYSHLNGVPVFNHLDTSQPMLSKYLQQAGYYTGMVGK